VFQKAPFQRLIRETAKNYKQDLSFEQEALQLIQYYTEIYMTNLYTEARYILIAAKRETLEPRDLQMARSITGDAKKTHL
jgi:histone H3